MAKISGSISPPGSMWMKFCISYLLVLAFVQHGYSANWVQLNGDTEQNYITTTNPELSARWGAAYVTLRVLTSDNGRPVPEPRQRRLYVLGGEDWTSGTESSGRKRNDVWYTEGVRLDTTVNLIERTQFNERRPSIISNTEWVRSRADIVPPNDIDYRQWLCCVLTLQSWCVDPDDPLRSSVVCSPTDPFFNQRRWSPRNMHQAINIENAIYVLGGLAHSLSPLSSREKNSGFQGTNLKSQMTTPTNDIWKSTTGDSWELINPGCFVLQESHIDLPGSHRKSCSDDNDCLSARLGESFCFQGSCICSMWSPRWNFGTIYFNDRWYVLGGATWVSRHRCSEFACGDGYIRYLNDVWVSSDQGRSWSMLIEPAPWSPRLGFSLVQYGPLVYLMGGKGSDTGYPENVTFYNDVWISSDMENWVKNESNQPWSPRVNSHSIVHGEKIHLYGGQERLDDLPPEPPRLPFQQIDDAIADSKVTNIRPQPSPSPFVDPRPGETFSGIRMRTKNDLWVFDPKSPRNGWVEDPVQFPARSKFVSIHDEWGKHSLLNVSSEVMDSLASYGIFTVAELADAPDDMILQALNTQEENTISDICFYRLWAEDLKYRCTVQDRGFDGDWIRDYVIDETFAFARNVGEERRKRERMNDPCYSVTGKTVEAVPEILRDVQCDVKPGPRHSGIFVSMRDILYLGLGSQTTTSPLNDFWHRDDIFPETRIVRAPASGSADSVFDFESSKRNVVFQYRLFILRGEGNEALDSFEAGTSLLARNWSAVSPPLNLGSTLDSGFWRFEVRSVDASGKRDDVEIGRNVHEWEFVPPFPYLLVIGLLVLFLILIVALFLWYRKRRRRKALERQALKRMRRRLKIIESGKLNKETTKENKNAERKRKTKEQVRQEKLEHAALAGERNLVKNTDRRGTARSMARSRKGRDTGRTTSEEHESDKKKKKKKKRKGSKKRD